MDCKDIVGPLATSILKSLQTLRATLGLLPCLKQDTRHEFEIREELDLRKILT